MRQTLLLLLLILPTVAQAEAPAVKTLNAEEASSCRVGMRVYESDRGRQLLGEVVPGDFPRLLPGWDAEFATYQPAPEDVAFLAALEEDIEILCILGTWCHDSQREVPRFWKILEDAGNPHLELTMFGVGRSSDSQALKKLEDIGFDIPLRQEYGIEFVPTFIFRRDGQELGRIIETPETTLEQDAARILSGKIGKPAQPSWQ